MSDLSPFELTGNVALVTGATHGLGMAMANGLGAAGAVLVIDGNQNFTGRAGIIADQRVPE